MNITHSRKKLALVAGGAVVLAGVAAGGAFAIAGGDDDGTDRPIPESVMKQASEAALAETGGGRVTETEVDDEESKYEVEVTLDDGTQVDVQLDEDFEVVGTKTEAPGDDDD